MRNSNAHAYSSGALSLSGLDGLLVASLIVKVAYLVVEVYQNVDSGEKITPIPYIIYETAWRMLTEFRKYCL